MTTTSHTAAPARVTGAQLAPKALEVAHGFAASGLREATGHNDGTQIDKIEKFFGLQGEPYCAMGVAFCYMKAFAFLSGKATDDATLRAILEHDIPNYFFPSPSCGSLMDHAKDHGIWKKFTSASGIHPGDLVLFAFKEGATRPQHVGIFDHAEDGQVVCVEFNTGAGAAGNQADGQGCFVRKRSGSVVLGSISVNK